MEYFSENTATISRSRDMIYAISDTTEISLPKTQIRDHFGYGTKSKESRSFFVHTTISIDEKGLPLGILHQRAWNRDRKNHGKKHQRKALPIEEKESFKWIESAQAVVDKMQDDPEGPRVLMIGDRESDIYEYFEYIKTHNLHALVRSTHNRNIDEEEGKLWDHVSCKDVSHRVKFNIPRRPQKKERIAHLEIRFSSGIEIFPPKNLIGNHDSIPVSIIVVEESNPSDPRDRICWRLITTLQITKGQEAWAIAQKYKYRWYVEEFHYILKSGCRIEKLQFETFERYIKALVILSQVAFELLRLKYLSRISPDIPASEILTETEILVLKAKAQMYNRRAPPPVALTIKEAVKIIGKMGGHLGRKSDGMPGIKVLWMGWNDLQTIADIVPELKKIL